MKTVLVLTDFSSPARRAAEAALKIAARFSAEVLLFHSYSLPLISTQKNIENDYAILEGKSLVKLQKERDRVIQSEYFQKLDHQPKISVLNSIRPLADNLYELQQSKNIILVMMGERRDKRNSFLFGNHIHVAMRNSACPLLIVTGKGYEPFKTKGNFACDFESEDMVFVDFLARLAAKFSTNLFISHVSPPTVLVPDFREQDKLSEFTKNFRRQNHANCQLKYLVSYDLVEEIERFNRASDVGLLVLVNREHNLFWNLFNKKASKAFLGGQHLPILVLPDKLSSKCLKLMDKHQSIHPLPPGKGKRPI